eukprot:6491773-Amphidinium_carterae.3
MTGRRMFSSAWKKVVVVRLQSIVTEEVEELCKMKGTVGKAEFDGLKQKYLTRMNAIPEQYVLWCGDGIKAQFRASGSRVASRSEGDGSAQWLPCVASVRGHPIGREDQGEDRCQSIDNSRRGEAGLAEAPQLRVRGDRAGC